MKSKVHLWPIESDLIPVDYQALIYDIPESEVGAKYRDFAKAFNSKNIIRGIAELQTIQTYLSTKKHEQESALKEVFTNLIPELFKECSEIDKIRLLVNSAINQSALLIPDYDIVSKIELLDTTPDCKHKLNVISNSILLRSFCYGNYKLLRAMPEELTTLVNSYLDSVVERNNELVRYRFFEDLIDEILNFYFLLNKRSVPSDFRIFKGRISKRGRPRSKTVNTAVLLEILFEKKYLEKIRGNRRYVRDDGSIIFDALAKHLVDDVLKLPPVPDQSRTARRVLKKILSPYGERIVQTDKNNIVK